MIPMQRDLGGVFSRGDWDESALHFEISSDHPVWKHLWMRREDLMRADFDDEVTMGEGEQLIEELEDALREDMPELTSIYIRPEKAENAAIKPKGGEEG